MDGAASHSRFCRKALNSIPALFPASLFQTLKADFGIRERRRVFSLQATVRLMITQRLTTGTLASAVMELVNGNGWDALEPCRRVLEGGVSTGTGAYSQARMRIPVEVARRVAQHSFRQLYSAGTTGELRDRLFVVDGSSIRLAHSKALRKAYPLAQNQHGDSHWPVMRVCVLHHLASGLAVAPACGPMYGANAVGEQELAVERMSELPASSVLMGDRNFGVFSVVWSAKQAGHDVLLRLSDARARSLNDDAEQQDRQVVWRPSKADRRQHEFPAEAHVEGRLLRVEMETGEPLYLFTTLTEPAEVLASLYKERWTVETDLRSLKEQMKLHVLTSKTPDMAVRELMLAMAAYNLVRAVMVEAARQAGIDSRRISYSRAQLAFCLFARKVSAGCCSDAEYQQHWKLLMRMLSQCKLPNRKRASAPRAVWLKRAKFPTRKQPQGEN